MISLLNEKFVNTWVLIDDLKQKSGPQNRFASVLAAHWEYPMDLMFLDEHGDFVSKLNSFTDLHGVHLDVGHDANQYDRLGPSHLEVFMQHVQKFLKDH